MVVAGVPNVSIVLCIWFTFWIVLFFGHVLSTSFMGTLYEFVLAYDIMACVSYYYFIMCSINFKAKSNNHLHGI